jgi:hypothetical protein
MLRVDAADGTAGECVKNLDTVAQAVEPYRQQQSTDAAVISIQA